MASRMRSLAMVKLNFGRVSLPGPLTCAGLVAFGQGGRTVSPSWVASWRTAIECRRSPRCCRLSSPMWLLQSGSPSPSKGDGLAKFSEVDRAPPPGGAAVVVEPSEPIEPFPRQPRARDRQRSPPDRHFKPFLQCVLGDRPAAKARRRKALHDRPISNDRRCTVARLTPNNAAGSFRHEQPACIRHTMAASTARSSAHRVPPPCGRGAGTGSTAARPAISHPAQRYG
jgi:hypothetical protein